MHKKIQLEVMSAFLVDGKIVKIGDVVEVSEHEAKQLLHRGKAVLSALQFADVSTEQQPEQPEQVEQVEQGNESAGDVNPVRKVLSIKKSK